MKRTQVATSVSASLLLMFCMLRPQPFSPTVFGDDQESGKFAQLLGEYYEEYLRLNPLRATAAGDHRFDDQFANDISEEYRSKQEALCRRYLQRLSNLKPTLLTGQDKLSFQCLKQQLEINLERTRFEHLRLMPINQFFGNTLLFPRLGSGNSFHPFKTVRDYDNFLGRIRGFQVWSDTALANMQKGMASGFVLPKPLAEKVLPQLQSMLVADVKQSLFYQPVANMPADFSDQDKARLITAYSKAIQEQIIPSYRKLHDFIQAEYLPKCRTTSGFSALPKGKEFYVYLVKFYTTTSRPPDEIFKIGMDEVARIKAEMEKVKGQIGFQGDLGAFFDDLRTNPSLFPFTSENEVLNAYRAIESKMQPRLSNLFGIVPKAKFEVRATEKFRAASAAAQYQAAAPDGSRPGIFYVPILDATKYRNLSMEALFLHEAIPGHHYQASLQQEERDLPKFRQHGGYPAYAAFIEGWGLYAEGLGKELGLYKDNYQYFGRLQSDMHRAVRLVVDVGLHWKGWSREEAIRFMMENNAAEEKFAISEIERYMAGPGQALSYKMGELKILELRQKTEKVLGSKFSLRAFHDELLKDGALPLDVLESKMTEWLASQQ